MNDKGENNITSGSLQKSALKISTEACVCNHNDYF